MKNYTNKQFGKITVIEFVGKINGSKYNSWKYKCECGKEGFCNTSNLKRMKSCGCVRKNHFNNYYKNKPRDFLVKHGHCINKNTKTYTAWQGMLRRCDNPNNKKYHLYGGKGIKVCQRWKDSFENFLADMGEAPENFSLERIDGNKDYEPSNCKWATAQEQARNTTRNRWFTINGETKILADWIKEAIVVKRTVFKRLAKGMSIEDALWK